MSNSLSQRQQALKQEFEQNRGYWNEVWDRILTLSPDFFEAYSKFSSVPWKTGSLEPKVREFIYIAIDSATTHLFEPGIRIHMQNAFAHGATEQEIMEVLQLTSVLGIHTCATGVPILCEELEAAGLGSGMDGAELSDEQLALKQRFQALRGYWSPLWDQLLELSPAFFEAYLELSAVPWTHGTLSPKVKELIYIAIDCSTTHLYEPGLRLHIRNAIAHGASKAEIMEVFQLVSVLGIHSCTVGVPIMAEEASRFAGTTTATPAEGC
ncbi:MAG: carboxymuconolactone decarboxylase family protein [Gammaproteobacteria bacterium]|nr:carboxymuconolactone decarboxylase family protein [Gammaproteobacteria bacterium]